MMLGYHANWKFMGSPDKVSTVALQRHFSILLDQKAKFFCASKISSNLRLFIAPVSQNANMQIDRSHSAEKGLRTQGLAVSAIGQRFETSLRYGWYGCLHCATSPAEVPTSLCVVSFWGGRCSYPVRAADLWVKRSVLWKSSRPAHWSGA